MNIILLSPGKTKNQDLQNLIDDFYGRIKKFSPTQLDFFKVRKDENQEIIERIKSTPGNNLILVFDEKGAEFTSQEFAKFVKQKIDNSPTNLILVVGGAYGLNDDVRAMGNKIVAFSKMTFTHEFARVLVLEQIYRAYTIMNNMPYHH